MTAPQSLSTLIERDFVPKYTYDFSITRKAPVGVITAMTFTIGGKTLEADTPVSNPESPDAKLQVVGVLHHIRWEGNRTDPIIVHGRISPKNRGIFKDAISSLTGGANVEMTFAIYEYDLDAKKYYQSFSSDGKPVKFVLTEGVKHYVAPGPDEIVQQPVNYIFEVSLTAKSEEVAMLNCATSANIKFTREIGVPVTA